MHFYKGANEEQTFKHILCGSANEEQTTAHIFYRSANDCTVFLRKGKTNKCIYLEGVMEAQTIACTFSEGANV